jgi:outer membrane protein TolC
MTTKTAMRPPVSKISSLLLCAVVLGGSLFSPCVRAETLSRGKAVARALTQNPQIAASRAREYQAEARQGQAQAARYPQLTVTLGVGPSLQAELVPGSAIESTENAYGDVGFGDLSAVFGGQVEVLQPLYTFGKIDKREEAAEHEVRARQAQTDMTRADVAAQVAELYETALYARDVDLFFGEMEHWLNRTLEDTRSALETDSSLSEQDVLRLETALGAVAMAQNQARAGVHQTHAGLIAYLALPRGTGLEFSEKTLELLDPGPLDEEALVRLALSNRPELRALREGHAALSSLSEAEQADDLPDFFALAFASAAYTPGRELVDTRYYTDPLNHFVPGAIVGVRWRFNGSMATRRADVTRGMASELARTREWALHGLPAEVTKAFEDVQRARRDVEASDTAVQRAKKWTVQASADFGIGLGSTRDVTDASAAYAQLKVAYFTAKWRHNVALAQLARATGTLTTSGGRLYPTQGGVAPAASTPGAESVDAPGVPAVGNEPTPPPGGAAPLPN